MSYKAGESVALALEGRNLELSGKTAFVDKISGRIMVPLRETAKALGAQLYGFPMERNSEIDKTMVDHNYGLVDIGPDVKAYLDIIFESKIWRVYLTPETEQNTMISIDELSLALGYVYEWDKGKNTVNFYPENSD